jgi:hypothetical protein
MRKLSDIVALGSKDLKNIGENIAGLDLSKIAIDPKELEEPIRSLQKKEQRPLKSRVIMDYKDGLVVPVYEPTILSSIPVFIPMWVMNYNGKLVVAVNLTQRARQDKKTKDITIYPKTLFGLLLAGSVMRALITNEQSILSSTKLLTSLSKIYSNIFVKILDKSFAISANEVYLDQIRYLTAKFFLSNVAGRGSSMFLTDIALKSTVNSSRNIVLQVDGEMPVESYENINSFVNGLSKTFKRLSELKYRNILAEMVKLYSAPSFLMAEYLPFFVANILLAETGSGVNNEFSFETAMGKEGTAVYAELSRLI